MFHLLPASTMGYCIAFPRRLAEGATVSSGGPSVGSPHNLLHKPKRRPLTPEMARSSFWLGEQSQHCVPQLKTISGSDPGSTWESLTNNALAQNHLLDKDHVMQNFTTLLSENPPQGNIG